MKILITGSSGLIGSEVASYFASTANEVYGVDNNQREIFFGSSGSTRWVENKLRNQFPNYIHNEIDIRDRNAILELVKKVRPDAIVHAAAQPSHDKAAEIPFDDFETNALGTLNILEASRRFSKDAPFIYLSTNKVYGDLPNKFSLRELDTRWDFADDSVRDGVDESLSIDQSLHSLFGASKLSADILVQEYGRYFDMPTCCLRGGCLTGPSHSGVKLHGFLSYLIKCNVMQLPYTIFGYKGKQVRDNIHACDVASFIAEFIKAPRSGEVYNIGGGFDNSISILEAFTCVENITGKKMNYEYSDSPRIGDHIVYYSSLKKISKHYPSWSITKDIKTTILEICESWEDRQSVRFEGKD
jgi:CDP-paratose 2-epimerase